MTTAPSTLPDSVPAARVEALLAAAETAHAAELRAAAEKLALAAEWGELHPGDPAVLVDELGEPIPWGERELELAGDGAPTVAEFSVAEFAAALGASTEAGRNLVGDALELKHRLPRLWARVMAGEVPAWRARRVAQHTRPLPLDGAGFVDRQLAPVAHCCSLAQIERTTTAAAAEYDPEAVEEDRVERAHRRRFDIHLGEVGLDGLVWVDGIVDAADALALEQAIRDQAHALLKELPEMELGVRRSIAAGRLANTALTGAEDETAREVVVYTHHDTRQTHHLVGVEATHSYVTVEQLVEWCQSAGTRVTVRPVIDLGVDLATDAYTPTARQVEQAVLTCPTCVFPGCGRPARACDLDHIVAWRADGTGGATTSWNLAPLCRGHHRLKTHGRWTYRRLTWTSFEWTSPTGRTHTVDLTDKRRRPH
jgi:hypothetical protein